MNEDINLVIETLRGIQRHFELSYNEFRTDRGIGETLESLICEFQNWKPES